MSERPHVASQGPGRRLLFANEFLRAGVVGIALVALATLAVTVVGAVVALLVATLL